MLESISWQTFFTAVVIILGGYYAIATLLLYRSEIANIFKQRNSNQSGGGAVQVRADSAESNNVMGSVRFDTNKPNSVLREETTNADELSIALSQDSEEPLSVIDTVEEILKADFIAIQTEINSLVEITAQSTREESTFLFRTLLSNYSQFIGTAFQGQVSQVIHDSCQRDSSHQFTLHEIDSWWAGVDTKSETH